MTLPNVDPGLGPDEEWCPRCGHWVVLHGMVCEFCESDLALDAEEHDLAAHEAPPQPQE